MTFDPNSHLDTPFTSDDTISYIQHYFDRLHFISTHINTSDIYNKYTITKLSPDDIYTDDIQIYSDNDFITHPFNDNQFLIQLDQTPDLIIILDISNPTDILLISDTFPTHYQSIDQFLLHFSTSTFISNIIDPFN